MLWTETPKQSEHCEDTQTNPALFSDELAKAN